MWFTELCIEDIERKNSFYSARHLKKIYCFHSKILCISTFIKLSNNNFPEANEASAKMEFHNLDSVKLDLRTKAKNVQCCYIKLIKNVYILNSSYKVAKRAHSPINTFLPLFSASYY